MTETRNRPVVDALVAYCLPFLSADQHELFEERAAIRQYDGA